MIGRASGRDAASGSPDAFQPEPPRLGREGCGRSAVDEVIAGPAIIEDPDCTCVVPPGDTVSVTADGHLMIEIAKETAQGLRQHL